MRIVQVNSSDSGGGAEGIALVLHREYRRRRHDATLLVAWSLTGEAGVAEFEDAALRSRWTRAIRSAARALGALDGRFPGAARVRRALPLALGQPATWWAIRRGREDFDHPTTEQLLTVRGSAPDIVHAHNLHGGGLRGNGYFDLRALAEVSQVRPVFLTLHDAWLLSGHCAHSFECERWLSGCGDCPDLSIYPAIARDATAFNWRRKRDIYARSVLRVATPSRWLMDKVERSMLAPGVVESRVIPYGIDVELFRPGDRAEARDELGLPSDRPIVMFAANGLRANPFKDLALLRSALEAVSQEPLLLLAVGEEGPAERHGEAELRFVGRRDPATMAALYRAADVYAHPSRADTFPVVVLEAMACGTPVVATAVGGIPEQVADGETGLLAPPGDARAFADALRSLIADRSRREALGVAGAERAARRYALATMVDAYLDWYAEALEQ
ncbi:MAG TPA: glycosyltransferase [Gaiellaceae bacterium]|nr:glycosyltransferase [Gaiellaceae bacterium]